MLASLFVLGSVVGVPTIPKTYTADVTAATSGTAPGAPKGQQTYKQYYDYANKRNREDFLQEGFSKIYRYDVNIEPPVPPVPGQPVFASPKGYKIDIVGGAPDPNRCCWTWLVDQDGNADTMFEQEVASKAVDVGSETINGVPAEHWHFKGYFPIEQINDYWFTNSTNGTSTLVQENSFASIYKQGTIIGNVTYANFNAGPIDVSTFKVPTSDPTFGVCKPCNDPSCDCSSDDFKQKPRFV